MTKTRLPGNSNRTIIFEFLPKQFKALLDGIEKTIEQVVSDTTKKLRKKQKTLKSELKQANLALGDLDEQLDEAIAERDEALAQVEQLAKKPSEAVDDPQKVKNLERELQRIKGLFDKKSDKNKSLNSQRKRPKTVTHEDRLLAYISPFSRACQAFPYLIGTSN